MINFNTFINTDEISREDFNLLIKGYNLEVYTKESLQRYVEDISNLIEKGEEGSELSESDRVSIEFAKSELQNLKKYTVIDLINGQITKTPLYVQELMISK